MKNFSLLLIATLAFVLPQQSNADTLLFSDNFDSYTDGDLVPQGGWANHSGTGTFVPVTSGQITLQQGSGSREDVNHNLGAVMGAGDVWRYEFDVTINGTGAASNSYFAHFRDNPADNNNLFNSRLFVAAPVAGGDFTFGVDETSGSAPTGIFSNDFSYGTTYRVFAEYSYDLGSTSVWIDSIAGGVITSTNLDPNQPMEAIAFRQAAGNTSMVIDNLQVFSVSAVPEPTSAGILGLVALTGCLVRRRR